MKKLLIVLILAAASCTKGKDDLLKKEVPPVNIVKCIPTNTQTN